MTESKPSTVRRPAAAGQRVLPWQSSLQTKIALLFVLLILLLGAAAYWIGGLLVRDDLVEETFRYEQESGQRLANQIGDISAQTQLLANSLALIIGRSTPDADALRALVPQLVERSDSGRLIVSVGVWPQADASRERSSHYWLRDANRNLQLRDDYNDPRAIAYTAEPWYAPARYARVDRCYWAPVYRELLAKEDVITCTMPLRNGGEFAGAVTINLSVAALNAEFTRAASTQSGYSLLVDRDGRLLAMSNNAAQIFGAQRPRNLAELSQRFESFKPLASYQHQQDEAFVRKATQSPLYDATQVSALQAATRGTSRQEAEAAMAMIWNTTLQRSVPKTASRQVALSEDAVLHEAGFATLFELPQNFWTLIRVTPSHEGFSGARYIFMQTLVVVGGALILTLILVFSGLRLFVIRPLRKMTQQLSRSESVDDALHLELDESPRNELGVLAHWHNERIRQLRELMERNISSDSLLATATGERRNTQDLLARIQERSAAALHAVADGVIATGENGRIEDMNAVAEQLTGAKLRLVRGQELTSVLKLRSAEGTAFTLQSLVELAIQRGTRLDHDAALWLLREGQPDLEIQLSLTPIQTRQNHGTGIIAVLRERASTAASPAEVSTIHDAADALTGLPARAACDRRIRELLTSLKHKADKHAVLNLDVDHLKQINDLGGMAAGDEVLARFAETLTAKAGKAGSVYRLNSDQFVIVLAKFDAERAIAFAEALRESITTAHFSWESKPLDITASIGVVAFGAEADNPAEVLRRADDACAAAKRAGRNNVKLYEPAMDRTARLQDDSLWIRRIRDGIDKNLFHLTTQWMQAAPQFAAEGQCFDLQLALEDEEGFWAAPEAFMPAAERYQLALEMDRWTIQNTLAYLSNNPAVMDRLSFCSLKLSLSTIVDRSLLEFLAESFQSHASVAPQKLCFVVDESLLLEQPAPVQSFCDAMRTLGCRVVLDRYSGRDISDLGLIRRLSPDFVRMDAQRLANIATDTLEQMLAESAVKVARMLQKRVIVSEIGNTAQLEAWKRYGVDYVQGPLLARTSPVIFFAPAGHS